MPATSATTTNHYIINNLNIIGTPNSSRANPGLFEQFLPPQATQRRDATALHKSAAQEPKADGFDLIMQDG